MEQKTLLQFFEWYLPENTDHWRWASQQGEALRRAGFTSVWLPPAYKGAQGIRDVGYGVYDLYDLGEFQQKGAVPTKYGTRDDYLAAIRALQGAGLEVLADIVLNHRMGADGCEDVAAHMCAPGNRLEESLSTEHISAWTRFTFPGRQGKYSGFQWNHTHFDGVDWDDRRKKHEIYQFEGKEWDRQVDWEHGNYDYLMGADLDMENPEVVAELDRWGDWYLDTTHVDGFRLDAVKHISFSFFTHWLGRLRERTGKSLFAVGEYWSPELSALTNYLDRSGQVMDLFDVPLHFHFCQAASSGGSYDMRDILKDTLVSTRPDQAVTFVDNHDTQPGQALQSWVQGWFKPLAYALILLRQEGTPCVFFGDYFGIPHDHIDPVGEPLRRMLQARQRCAIGEQTDYFDDCNCIGWTRSGTPEAPESGLAVLLSDGAGSGKTMCVGSRFAGVPFVDCLGNRTEEIVIGSDGCGTFQVNGGSVSVWVPKAAIQTVVTP